MAQIVDPHALKARLLADAPPGALQIGEVRAGDLAGFLPRFLGIERFSQVLHLLPVYFGEVGVQLDGCVSGRGKGNSNERRLFMSCASKKSQ